MTNEIKYDEAKLKEIQGRLDAVVSDEPWQRGGFHWGDHTITAGGNTYIADCGDNIMSDRIAELVVAARPDLGYLLSLCRAQHEKNQKLIETLSIRASREVEMIAEVEAHFREENAEAALAELRTMFPVPDVLSVDYRLKAGRSEVCISEGPRCVGCGATISEAMAKVREFVALRNKQEESS